MRPRPRECTIAASALACGSFFSHPADALVCICIEQAKRHPTVGEERQRPALAARRCGATSFGEQAGLRLCFQRWLFPGARPFLQRPQALFHKALAGPFDRRPPDGEGGSNGTLRPTLGRFEQHAGAGHLARGMRPTVQQGCELGTFIFIERHNTFFSGPRWSSWREDNQTLSHTRIFHQIQRDGALGQQPIMRDRGSRWLRKGKPVQGFWEITGYYWLSSPLEPSTPVFKLPR